MNTIKTKFKIGDKVKVITGTQKGLIGNILNIDKKKSSIFLDNLTPRVTYRKNTQGGEPKKQEIQVQIHLSNVMLWDKEANQSSKIGSKLIDGKKQRYFKKSGNIL
mgnify:CR=1 FL=1